MIKEKYTQLCLAHRFGGINTIEFTQTLGHIQKDRCSMIARQKKRMFFRSIENNEKYVFQKLNLLLLFLILVGSCTFKSKHEEQGKQNNNNTIDTTINNVLFTFPSSGYA